MRSILQALEAIGLKPNEKTLDAGQAAFGRFCIILLSAEWILFGSMHFSAPALTVAQMPDWFPAREAIAVITGMIEVTIGILFLMQRTRVVASVVSLVLLFLYLLPVFEILRDPAALCPSPTDCMAPPLAAGFRLLLIPNNVLLAICSVFLFENRKTSVFGDPDVRPAPASAPAGDAPVLLVACLLLACNCAGFLAVWIGVRGHFAEAAIWAMACLALGALLGFLFGVPKLNRSLRSQDRLLPNTNIEDVSDWVTKIIVGVGLVNLTKIGEFLQALSERLGTSLGLASPTFATGLILYFSALGVIEGYVLTRLFLAREFDALTRGAVLPDAQTEGAAPTV